MSTYNVYQHPEQGVKVVKTGFCWWALFIFPLWFIYKQLGQELLRITAFVSGVLGIMLTCLAAYNYIMGNSAFDCGFKTGGLLVCVMVIIYCFKAGDLYSARLEELGYELVTTVQAETASSAAGLVVERKTSGAAVPVS